MYLLLDDILKCYTGQYTSTAMMNAAEYEQTSIFTRDIPAVKGKRSFMFVGHLQMWTATKSQSLWRFSSAGNGD